MHVTRDGHATEEFSKVMMRLANALGAKIEPMRIVSYARLLSDVPLDELMHACGRVAREARGGFFPSAGEIRAQVRAPMDEAALLAWAALDRAATEVGAYASVELQDPCAADALVSVFGSWPGYCDVEQGPALALKRQEFLAAYKQACRQRRGAGPVRLAGRCGPAPAGLESHTWVAMIGPAGVRVERDRPQLEAGDASRPAALPQGTTETEGEARPDPAVEGEAAKAKTRGGSHRRGPAGGDAPGRPVPAGRGRSDGAVRRANRVGTSGREQAVQDARPAAGGAAHDGGDDGAV